MEYKNLILKMIEYGKGVFTITMLNDENERQNLKRFVYRNPQLFKQIKGTHGDVKLIITTALGKSYFCKDRPIKSTLTTSENYFTLLDIGLINAFMIEKENFNNYKIIPRENIDLAGTRIGLISSRWGFPLNPEETDVILATKGSIKNINLNQSIREKIYTPKAFNFLRCAS